MLLCNTIAVCYFCCFRIKGQLLVVACRGGGNRNGNGPGGRRRRDGMIGMPLIKIRAPAAPAAVPRLKDLKFKGQRMRAGGCGIGGATNTGRGVVETPSSAATLR